MNIASDEFKRAERVALTRSTMLFSSLVFGYWVVSALSRTTEWKRAGIVVQWHLPWMLEGTSLIFMMALFFLVWKVDQLWPIERQDWKRLLIIHGGGSVAFSSLHIIGMVMSRKLLWPPIYGIEYHYLREPIADILYDYRKDAVTYATALAFIYLFRSLAFSQLEKDAALNEARLGNRITINCGGRTVFLDASSIEYAKAAGNYVELVADGSEYFCRMTLSELEKLLGTSQSVTVRVHKSWLVNLDRVQEIVAKRQGDFDLILANGKHVPGSRRYRDKLTI